MQGVLRSAESFRVRDSGRSWASGLGPLLGLGKEVFEGLERRSFDAFTTAMMLRMLGLSCYGRDAGDVHGQQMSDEN